MSVSLYFICCTSHMIHTLTLNVRLIFIEPKQTPSKGLRVRGQARLYGVARKDKDIGGISQEDASEALTFAIEHPDVISRHLETAQAYHSSTQESYGSVEAATDISALAKKQASATRGMPVISLGYVSGIAFFRVS